MSTYWLINAQTLNNYLFFDPVNIKLGQHFQLRGWKDVPKFFKEFKKDSKLISHLIYKKKMEYKFIDDKIAEKGLPKKFGFLPLILTGYQSSSSSKRGGSGIWDLNYITALHHGLVMNRTIDQRKNDSIASVVAINELERLLKLYKDEKWCMMAYIYSPSYVHYSKEKMSSSDKYVKSINDQYKNIVEFMNFLESLSLASNNLEIKSTDSKLVKFKLSYDLTFDAICFFKKINLNDFKRNNPELINSTIPSNYPIKSNVEDKEFLSLNQEKIFHFQDSMVHDLFYKKDTTIKKVHLVKKGDVLGSISQKYNVSIQNIKHWNDLTNNTIYIDQELKIYSNANFIENQFNYYTLNKNEKLWEIIQSNANYHLLDILKYNKYSSIKTAKRLKITKK